MSEYANVSFQNKLPEEFLENEFAKLVNLKNMIDLKLKSLEKKIGATDVMHQISKEETEIKHIKAGVFFLPIEQFN